MRIIAGSARGARLYAPKGLKVRPTSDAVREAAFNIIAGRIVGARFLDLFAGTGAVGIEALSRGAATATFVDSHQASVRTISRNLVSTGFASLATLLNLTYETALARLARHPPFHVIFIDPPYDSAHARQALRLIAHYGLAAAGGILMVETRIRTEPAAAFKNITLHRTRRYGDTLLHVYLVADEEYTPSIDTIHSDPADDPEDREAP
ncbi:16S rRNA (guanine(966)-N(2))-methyltransferase RsmD [bacterium]|nr:16S rRNA (guanine(966)-N(2))-methyltransferase RsmD [candidate division CSSED10-310 bacterium]